MLIHMIHGNPELAADWKSRQSDEFKHICVGYLFQIWSFSLNCELIKDEAEHAHSSQKSTPWIHCGAIHVIDFYSSSLVLEDYCATGHNPDQSAVGDV